MLIETPKASAKAKSEDTTSRKGMYGVCVCSFKRTQLDWGRGTCLQKEVGGGGWPSVRHWPMPSRSGSLGNTVSSSQRQPVFEIT